MFKTIQQQADEELIVRSVLCLGEIGVFVDLSKMNGIIDSISALFGHSND